MDKIKSPKSNLIGIGIGIVIVISGIVVFLVFILALVAHLGWINSELPRT